MELTPEERQRIYEEEKARMEIQQELQEQNKGTGRGSLLGYVFLGIFALCFILVVIGSMAERADSQRFDALSPEQKRAQTLRNCASLEADWAFKTYSELTQLERKMKASCEYYESESRPVYQAPSYPLTPAERRESERQSRDLSIDGLIRRRYEAEGKKPPK